MSNEPILPRTGVRDAAGVTRTGHVTDVRPVRFWSWVRDCYVEGLVEVEAGGWAVVREAWAVDDDGRKLSDVVLLPGEDERARELATEE